MLVPIGSREYELGSEHLVELTDSNDALDNPGELQRRMTDDGYLLIRGLQPREKVVAARRVVIDAINEAGMIKSGTDPMDGIINDEAEQQGASFHGKQQVTHQKPMLDLLESPEIMSFFDGYFGEPSITYDHKWLRVVPNGGFTGAHYDVVYMGRGTQDHLFTCWTPLGDVPIEQGPLVLCLGSHNLPGFKKVRDTYGKMDVDRDRVGGWFENDPQAILDRFGGKWGTTNFQAGDVLLFTMFTMHGSVNNQTNRFRISTDTRYQPASAPVDDRWVGKEPKGHYAWHKDREKIVPMETARSEWGI